MRALTTTTSQLQHRYSAAPCCMMPNGMIGLPCYNMRRAARLEAIRDPARDQKPFLFPQQTSSRAAAASSRRSSGGGEAAARQHLSVRRAAAAANQRASPEQAPPTDGAPIMTGGGMFHGSGLGGSQGFILQQHLPPAEPAAAQHPDPQQLRPLHGVPAAQAGAEAVLLASMAMAAGAPPPDAAALSPPSLEALGCSGSGLLRLTSMPRGQLDSEELEIRELTLPSMMVRHVTWLSFWHERVGLCLASAECRPAI